MRKHILVTGGAGFIGSHLTDILIERGFQVVVMDNLFTGRMQNLFEHLNNPNFTFFERDICSPLDDIFQDHHFDVVFHLAAAGRVRHSFQAPLKTHSTNVLGTINVLEASKKYGVGKFIFASSSSVYGFQKEYPLRESAAPHPASPYGMQKWQAEQWVSWYAAQFGMDSVSLRFFNVYGPRQRGDLDHAPLIPQTLKSIASGTPPIVYGKGNHTRDFTFITDIMDGIQLAAFGEGNPHRGRAINLGAGKNYSVLEVVHKILHNSGSSLSPLFQAGKNEPRDTLADLELAAQLLNYAPKISLNTGLSRTLDWYRTA